MKAAVPVTASTIDRLKAVVGPAGVIEGESDVAP